MPGRRAEAVGRVERGTPLDCARLRGSRRATWSRMPASMRSMRSSASAISRCSVALRGRPAVRSVPRSGARQTAGSVHGKLPSSWMVGFGGGNKARLPRTQDTLVGAQRMGQCFEEVQVPYRAACGVSSRIALPSFDGSSAVPACRMLGRWNGISQALTIGVVDENFEYREKFTVLPAHTPARQSCCMLHAPRATVCPAQRPFLGLTTASPTKHHAPMTDDYKRDQEERSTPTGNTKLPATSRPNSTPSGRPNSTASGRPNSTPSGRPNSTPSGRPELDDERAVNGATAAEPLPWSVNMTCQAPDGGIQNLLGYTDTVESASGSAERQYLLMRAAKMRVTAIDLYEQAS